jgi:hypothetical protein
VLFPPPAIFSEASMTAQRPLPLSSDLGLRRAVATPIVRAVLAHARAGYTPDRNPSAIARKTWPQDRDTLSIINRAATAPARTDTAGWAQELAVNHVSELLIALGPTSAGSQLLRRANMLTLGRFESVKVPALVASASNASFIGEGGAIPIRQLDTSKSVTLTPKKFASGFDLTRELISSSNAESLVRMVMVNSVALSLDVVLFSNAAATAVAPPGLLYNIVPLVPSTGGGQTAFVDDIAALAGSVATVGGLDLVFVAGPSEAVKILLNAGPRFTFPVLASSALAATKTVACFAPVAIVAAADPAPDIEESRTAVVHMSDTPTDISDATPVKSMFQLDSSAFRVIFDVDWGLLNPGGAAVINGVTW